MQSKQIFFFLFFRIAFFFGNELFCKRLVTIEKLDINNNSFLNLSFARVKEEEETKRKNIR
jgi:hypothetical protein